MTNKSHIILYTLSACVIILLLLSLASAVMQLSAAQTFQLTQQLLPLLDALGYDYWLDWGTLLGARREGGMIAHDYDADIGMRESSFQRLKTQWAQQPHLFGNMKLKKESAELYRIRLGIGWVDVFRYDDSSKTGTLRMLSMQNQHHSCKCPGRGHTTNKELIYPLRRLRFGTVTANVPNATDMYLTHLYGSDWMTPRVNRVARLLKLFPTARPITTVQNR